MNYIKVCHKFEIVNNKKEFVVYADYPFEYEFGLDFNIYKEKVKEVTSEIKKYVKSHLESVKDATAILVLNGVIIGTFAISQIIEPNASNTNTKETNLVAEVADEGENTINNENISDTTLKEDNNQKDYSIEKEENMVTNISSSSAQAVKIGDLVNKVENKDKANKQNKLSDNVKNSNVNNNITKEEVKSEKTVKVKLNNNEVVTISLEEYVTGVVCSEMPALFSDEALKAQSVAARTYALKKDSVGATLVASTSDQVYKTNSELKSMWGNSFNTYYEKVKKAVMATKGEVMMYNGKYIDALYFSTSNGRTEDPIYVWNYSAPYLKSVDSKWDIGTKFFNATKTILSYAGFGDILMTCTSTNSRNYSYGKLIGEGKLNEAKDYALNTTVEGLYTLKSIKDLIKKEKVKMPIIDLISDIICGNKDKESMLTFLIEKK